MASEISGLVGGHYALYIGNQISLGETEEGFTLEYEELFTEVKADRSGAGLRDLQFAGKMLIVTFIQLSWKQMLIRLLKQTGSFGGLKNLGKFMGQDNLALRVVCEPQAGNANDKYTFHKMVNKAKMAPIFSSTTPRKMNVSLVALPDFTKNEDEVFFTRKLI